MRKKIIKKPNPIGYAMLEKHGESNYVCLYDETAFDVVFEHAQEYIQSVSVMVYFYQHWNHRLRRSVKSIAQHQHGIRSWKSIH